MGVLNQITELLPKEEVEDLLNHVCRGIQKEQLFLFDLHLLTQQNNPLNLSLSEKRIHQICY